MARNIRDNLGRAHDLLYNINLTTPQASVNSQMARALTLIVETMIWEREGSEYEPVNANNSPVPKPKRDVYRFRSGPLKCRTCWSPVDLCSCEGDDFVGRHLT